MIFRQPCLADYRVLSKWRLPSISNTDRVHPTDSGESCREEFAPDSSLDCREIPASFSPNTRNMPIFRDNSSANRTAEKALLDTEGGIFLTFLWRAHAQSHFGEDMWRMKCDH
jgi:hypothetical protein